MKYGFKSFKEEGDNHFIGSMSPKVKTIIILGEDVLNRKQDKLEAEIFDHPTAVLYIN